MLSVGSIAQNIKLEIFLRGFSTDFFIYRSHISVVMLWVLLPAYCSVRTVSCCCKIVPKCLRSRVTFRMTLRSFCVFYNQRSVLCLEDKPKSTLSAEAKEWFPPNYVPPSQDNFYSNQENFDYYNQDAPNYEYSNYHTNHTNAPYFQGYDQVPYEQQRFSVQDRLRYHQHPEEYELQVC